MSNIIKTSKVLQEVPGLDNKFQSEVRLYINRNLTSDNFIERTIADFEKKSLDYNQKYFMTNSSNPLLYGLKLLDRMAMIIDNKTYTGTMEFVDKKLYSTPSKLKNSTILEAIDIVLNTLEMATPVTTGMRYKKPMAMQFNNLAATIAKQVKYGNLVYDNYHELVLDIGQQTIKEWSNS